MAGLLSRIGNAIQSPTAMGLLGAAATGFNPLLGLLAAPAIASGRERGAQENELHREDIRRRRMANEARQRQMTAQGQIPGLLRSAPPQLLDPSGDGLLAQPGAERTFQNRQMGILADLSPDAGGQALLQQMQPQEERAAPSDIRTMQALGIPLTPEGFQQFKTLSGDDIDNLLKRLQATEIIEGREREAQERQREQAAEVQNIQTTLRKGEKLLELNNRLEGTFLEPGGFGIEGRRPFAALTGEVSGALGFDEFSQRQRENVSTLDQFNKTANDFVLEMMGALEGSVTNDQLRALQSASAGIGTSPAANRAIVGEVIRASLEAADAGNFDIGENRERFEQMLVNLEGGGRVEDRGAADLGQVPAPEQIPGFDELSPEEQDELRAAIQGGT